MMEIEIDDIATLIKKQDAEIARLRSERDAARAELEVARQYPYCVGYDRGKEHLRSELDRTAAQLAEVREALESFAAIALERDINPRGSVPDCIAAPDLAITPADVRKARAALSRLSSPGAQQREDIDPASSKESK